MDGFKRPQQPRSATQQPPKAAVERSLPRPASMDGVARPQRQIAQPAETSSQAPTQQTADTLKREDLVIDASAPSTKQVRRPRRWHVVGILFAVLVALGCVGYYWLEENLQPVDKNDTTLNRFEVKDGSTFNDVAAQLEQRKLIRSANALDIYARLQGKRSGLKASTCSLKSSMSVGEILDKLSQGCHDFISVMFYPGATIEKPLYKPADATIDQGKMYIKYVLKEAGFSDAAITAALTKQYDLPLFADKPAGTTLEGYIFGETYYVDKSATAEDVLKETFAHMNSIVEKDDLVAKFKAHGLNLYQGITLASIVQRELNCEGKPTVERKERCYGYQRTIAQIFLKRLKEDISLGSDVTFIYAADMMKVAPSVDLDSPYNTRKYTGLPPGPIASPGELALKAVANPTDTDYLFFIAGDDGLIYFAKDAAGHEKNIQEHCQVMCGNAV